MQTVGLYVSKWRGVEGRIRAGDDEDGENKRKAGVIIPSVCVYVRRVEVMVLGGHISAAPRRKLIGRGKSVHSSTLLKEILRQRRLRCNMSGD